MRSSNANTVAPIIEVQLITEDDHRALTKYMKEKEIGFYAMKPSNQRPFKVVIKGLPTEAKTVEIRKDPTAKGFNTENIVQLKRFRDKYPLPTSVLS